MDPKKRQIYDQVGEEGLQGGGPGQGGPGGMRGGQQFHFAVRPSFDGGLLRSPACWKAFALCTSPVRGCPHLQRLPARTPSLRLPWVAHAHDAHLWPDPAGRPLRDVQQHLRGWRHGWRHGRRHGRPGHARQHGRRGHGRGGLPRRDGGRFPWWDGRHGRHGRHGGPAAATAATGVLCVCQPASGGQVRSSACRGMQTGLLRKPACPWWRAPQRFGSRAERGRAQGGSLFGNDEVVELSPATFPGRKDTAIWIVKFFAPWHAPHPDPPAALPSAGRPCMLPVAAAGCAHPGGAHWVGTIVCAPQRCSGPQLPPQVRALPAAGRAVEEGCQGAAGRRQGGGCELRCARRPVPDARARPASVVGEAASDCC